MEVLSYEIYLQAPQACILISNAMNSPHKAALRANELKAKATLSGDNLLHIDPAVAGSVCYETGKEKVRQQLDSLVDEPEFKELFDTVVSLGAFKNSYLREFLDWCTKFVSSKFRRLRLAACTELNKIPAGPHTKIASRKRCLREQPRHQYCPPPEKDWARYSSTQLEELEDLLRYFHVTCKPAVAVLPEVAQLTLLGNVDTDAATAFRSVPIRKHASERVQSLKMM